MDNASITEMCGNCKFGDDRLGGNRLVCINTDCYKYGSVVRSNWPGCFYHHQAVNDRELEHIRYEFPDDFYREQQLVCFGRESDRAMEPRECW